MKISDNLHVGSDVWRELTISARDTPYRQRGVVTDLSDETITCDIDIGGNGENRQIMFNASDGLSPAGGRLVIGIVPQLKIGDNVFRALIVSGRDDPYYQDAIVTAISTEAITCNVKAYDRTVQMKFDVVTGKALAGGGYLATAKDTPQRR